MSFPHYTQLDAMDCGPTSLKIIAQFYGKHYSLQTLRERCHITHEGVSLLGISDAAESIGFRTIGVKLTWRQLCDEANMPCIVHWNQRHFVVVYKITRKFGKYWVYVSDPALGLLKYSEKQFIKAWMHNWDAQYNSRTAMHRQQGDLSFANTYYSSGKGVALLLEPTPKFYKETGDEDKRMNVGYLLTNSAREGMAVLVGSRRTTPLG